MRPQHRRGRGVIAAAMTLAAVVGLGAQPAAAESTGASKARYRLTGYGTDHGVGLSQRGAAGRARAGQTYDQILLHYFDSRTTSIDTVAEGTTLRALVVKARAAASNATALVEGGRDQGSATASTSSASAGPSTPRAWTAAPSRRPGGSCSSVAGRTGAWHLEVQDATGKIRARFTDADARITVTPLPQGAGPAVTRVLAALLQRRTTPTPGPSASAVSMAASGSSTTCPSSRSRDRWCPTRWGRPIPSEALKAQAVAIAQLLPRRARQGEHQQVPGLRCRGVPREPLLQGRACGGPATSRGGRRHRLPGPPVRRWRTARSASSAPSITPSGGGATEASMNVFTTEKGTPGHARAVPHGRARTSTRTATPTTSGRRCTAWQTRALTLEQLSTDPRQGPAHQRGQAPRLARRHGGHRSGSGAPPRSSRMPATERLRPRTGVPRAGSRGSPSRVSGTARRSRSEWRAGCSSRCSTSTAAPATRWARR